VSKETEANGDAAIPTVKSVPAPSKEKSEHKVKARKRASDFLSDDEGEKAAGKELPASTDLPASAEDSVTPAKKKSKKSTLDSEPRKKAKLDAEPDLKEKKPKAISKSSLKETAKPAPTSDGEESADEDDDHTAALIKGFESSDDEDNSGDEGFEPGQEVPSIPDSKQVKRKLAKAKKRAAEKVEAEEPGVIYIR
jgi:nucleolar protein 15